MGEARICTIESRETGTGTGIETWVGSATHVSKGTVCQYFMRMVLLVERTRITTDSEAVAKTKVVVGAHFSKANIHIGTRRCTSLCRAFRIIITSFTTDTRRTIITRHLRLDIPRRRLGGMICRRAMAMDRGLAFLRRRLRRDSFGSKRRVKLGLALFLRERGGIESKGGDRRLCLLLPVVVALGVPVRVNVNS